VELARAAVAGTPERTAAAETAVAALECAGSALASVCTVRALSGGSNRAEADDPLRHALAAARAAVTTASYAVVEADDRHRLQAAGAAAAQGGHFAPVAGRTERQPRRS